MMRELGARYIRALTLHCTLLKPKKLRAGKNEKSGAQFLRESDWGEAGFEVHCTVLYDKKYKATLPIGQNGRK